ncbi:MAG: ATP-binding protein [Paludibacteraceae bacterium]|nr:ATP-binding protein [Paludibacteraceae bacterium]
MIQREIEQQVKSLFQRRKVILIMGARQVGKSTLLNQLFGNQEGVLWLNGDADNVQELLQSPSAPRLKAIIGNNRYMIIDEAQRIPNIGLCLKIIHDQIPNVQIIATGSSSFELAFKTQESLTGRKHEFKMYPLSFGEMVHQTSLLDELSMLEHRLVFGYYPEIVTHQGTEERDLRDLVDSYLFKDVLQIESIAKTDKIVKLLKALAYQIGNQISYNEIAQVVGLDSKTVEKYVDVLEQSYIVFRLGSYSRNLRNELKQSKKIYFYDLGVRNALIGNFTPAKLRAQGDLGAIWENFAITERMKRNAYREHYCQSYFWRTQQQQEIDYVEEKDGQLSAFEFKWNYHKTPKCPVTFTTAYSESTFQVISPQNIETFILDDHSY